MAIRKTQGNVPIGGIKNSRGKLLVSRGGEHGKHKGAVEERGPMTARDVHEITSGFSERNAQIPGRTDSDGEKIPDGMPLWRWRMGKRRRKGKIDVDLVILLVGTSIFIVLLTVAIAVRIHWGWE